MGFVWVQIGICLAYNECSVIQGCAWGNNPPLSNTA